MAVRFDGPVPPSKQRYREIVRVRSYEPMLVISLSEHIFSVFTHWHSGRSDRCTGDPASCPYCKDACPLRWRGYLHVSSPPNPDSFFLEFSENCAQAIALAFADRLTLRGSMFRISKSKGGLRGRFKVDPMDRVIDSRGLPEAQTPQGTLEFLWSVRRS
jgi:hypothetical protein